MSDAVVEAVARAIALKARGEPPDDSDRDTARAAISAYKAMDNTKPKDGDFYGSQATGIVSEEEWKRMEAQRDVDEERDEVIEECAKIADAEGLSPNASASYCAAAFHIGMCIRSLKSPAEAGRDEGFAGLPYEFHPSIGKKR